MNVSIDMPGIPTMNVGEIVRTLTGLYSGAILNGMPLGSLPAPMLWGSPGVGKSQAVRELAGSLERHTGKEVRLTDVRLLLFNPIDLRGIPVPNESRTLAVWLKPKIFDLDTSDEILNVILLDEITSALPTTMAASYQLVLDRKIGEHELPGNAIVICAGNRASDRSAANNRMPLALANRLLHIDVAADYRSWRAWAVEHGVDPTVIAYLAYRPDALLQFDPANGHHAFPSPRSWVMASRVIGLSGGDVEDALPLVSGLVGTGAASELATWARVWSKLPSVDDIFAGRTSKVPRGSDALYALVSAMSARARECKRKGDLKAIGRSIAYSDRLPADFGMLYVQDLVNLEPGFRSTLMRVPEFVRWAGERGSILDGA